MRIGAAFVAALTLGCSVCPPRWVDELPVRSGWIHATGECGGVFVDADATRVALTRAVRTICDELGLDVENGLSVVWSDGRLFVEAVGPDGAMGDLDDLELVNRTECDGRTYVLVRLPREG